MCQTFRQPVDGFPFKLAMKIRIAHNSRSSMQISNMTENLPQDAGENSLWGDTAAANPVTETLEDPLQVDVLVVGGGYTGLSSALHLAEKGASVVLLEAKSIGFGGSGRNAGLVNAGVWKSPDYVEQQLGQEQGSRFNQTLRNSPNLVFELVKRYRIDCDASQCGTINIAHKASAMRYLEHRCEQMQKIGASVEILDGDAAQALSGSPAYRHGGILDPTAGTIHPLNYAYGLAQAAAAQGARLYQQSPLESLSRQGNYWLAETENGQVTAEQVVIATNAYADDRSQGVQDSTLPVFIFQCATAALPPAVAKSIIPQRHGLWDTQTLMTSSRVDNEGRLVMSSVGSLRGFHRPIRSNWMMRMRNRLYPQARGLPWAYHWTGQVGLTSTRLLRIQVLAPGVFAPAGFNGRGIGPGTVIGKHLADTLVSGNRDEFPFQIECLHRESWRKSRSACYEYGTLALQLIDSR
ncbi:MAG: FAD-binding oxidoreductase [Gammaproteobacteria bacterium]